MAPRAEEEPKFEYSEVPPLRSFIFQTAGFISYIIPYLKNADFIPTDRKLLNMIEFNNATTNSRECHINLGGRDKL